MSEREFKYYIHRNHLTSEFAISVYPIASGGHYIMKGKINRTYKRLDSVDGRVVTRSYFDFSRDDYPELDDGFISIDYGEYTAWDAVEVDHIDWTTLEKPVNQFYSPSIMRTVLNKARKILFTDRWWNGEV